VYPFFILHFAFYIFLFSSCANYPTIPNIESTPSRPQPAPSAPPARETIGDVFQKKAPTLLSLPGGKGKDYEVGPEDVLAITVWDHDDLTRDVSVSQEGEFSYPLIGKVRAAGLTVSELEKEIRKRLDGRYIIDPQVTIAVKEHKSKKVFVLGEVGARGKGPGTYPLTGKTTLLEVLSLAGGPTKEAGSEVVVIRPKNNAGNPKSLEEATEDEIIKVNIRKLLDGDSRQNIYLEPNDTIYISQAEYFFVFGEVKKPGRYILENGTTVLKAITTAGGVTEIAAINRTKIVRERGGGKSEIPVSMTDPVQAEDIVMVPESFF
jgi:polysaccharide export outer membrane protein